MKSPYHADNTLYFSLGLRFLTQSSQYFYYTLMPILVIGLSAQPQEIKLTVSVFFLGLAFSLFCAGPLIDALSESKSFWLGLSIFLVGTLICFFSRGVYGMMVGRCVQGLALGLLQILSKSLLASNPSRSKTFALYQILINLAPPIAMLITSLILFFFPWQASFVFLLIISVFILWPGLHREQAVSSPSLKTIRFSAYFKIYWELFKDRRFLPLVISYSLATAIPAPFYVTATYTLTTVLHYQVHVIGLITAIFSVMGIAGTYISMLVEKTKYAQYILAVGFSLIILGCFLLFICALLFPPSIILFVAPLVFYIFGASFFYAKFNTLLMESFESISRNVTLSAMAVCVALISSIATLLASFHGHETLTQTSRLMLIMAVVSTCLYGLLYQPRKAVGLIK